MNKDWLEGNWKQLKSAVRETWDQLSDIDLDEIKGKEEELVGRIQEKYGLAKLEAQKAALRRPHCRLLLRHHARLAGARHRHECDRAARRRAALLAS